MTTDLADILCAVFNLPCKDWQNGRLRYMKCKFDYGEIYETF